MQTNSASIALRAAQQTRKISKMEIGQIIRAARKAKKLSLEQLAHQVDYDTGNLSRLERGQQSTTPDKLKKIMDVLGIKLAQVGQVGQGTDSVPDTGMSNVQMSLQPSRGPKEYPLVSWVIAGEWAESCDNFHPGDADTWIASVENAGDNGFWLDVRGDSMTCNGNPSFPEGSRILVQPEADVISGKYYVVKLDNGESTFKQYIEDAGIKYLRPLNQSYKTIQIVGECKFIGRVIDTKMTGL